MKRIHSPNAISRVIAGTLFLFTQLVAIAATAVGLIANSLEVGTAGILVLSGIAAIPSLAGLIVVARLAHDAETDPVNQ